MIPFTLLFAAVVGFHHAFEADHVLAVGNIVNKRKDLWQALRDGLFWGLGHTSMIFVVGCLIILGKTVISGAPFDFFEVLVGISLVILGLHRLHQAGLLAFGLPFAKSHAHEGSEGHTHSHTHKLAYSIGLIHGLAGSGAVILVSMTELQHAGESMLYLIIFGIGSIVGMMVVAGVFHLPFSRKIQLTSSLQHALVWLSALLCMGYGGWMVIRYFIS